MNSDHIQTESVKKYLLGTLPEPEASAIEERYFTNPQFFSQLRAAEIQLIGEYLDKKLSTEEHRQFEGRYLTVPGLREMVDRVRAQRVISASMRPRLRLVLVSSFAVIVIAALLLRKGQQPQQVVFLPSASGINLFLEPGVTKSSASQVKLLNIPRSGVSVSLIAELPGEISSVDYVARLKKVESDGIQPVLWISNPTRSAPRQSGQQVTVTLDSSFFSSGDYILELETQGKVRETYVFRAIASSH